MNQTVTAKFAKESARKRKENSLADPLEPRATLALFAVLV